MVTPNGGALSETHKREAVNLVSVGYIHLMVLLNDSSEPFVWPGKWPSWTKLDEFNCFAKCVIMWDSWLIGMYDAAIYTHS